MNESPARRRILVIQPMVGIGDMVWHKPWLDALIARHDITLMAKPSAQAGVILGEHERLTIIPLLRSTRGRRGRHDGVAGFFRLVQVMRHLRRDCGVDHLWVLHRSWRYAAAGLLAGIRYRSGYGIGRQQIFLNDSTPLDGGMKGAHPRDSVAAFCAVKGIVPDDTHPRITPHLHAVCKAARIIPPRSPLIICGVGAADAPRRWSPRRFAGLVGRLAASHPGHTIALCGSPAEEPIGAAITDALAAGIRPPLMVFNQPLDVVIALHQQAVLYVGNDTSLINIAAAVGTPAVRILAGDFPVLDSPLIETLRPPDADGAIDAIKDEAAAAAVARKLKGQNTLSGSAKKRIDRA